MGLYEFGVLVIGDQVVYMDVFVGVGGVQEVVFIDIDVDVVDLVFVVEEYQVVGC